jgi:hypothetical protein
VIVEKLSGTEGWGVSPEKYEFMVDGFEIDPFADDTPIEAFCDLENPEACESCQ